MLHVVRVFMGPGGSGGNPLGVFVDGGEIGSERRQAVAHDLDFSETVFVDSIDGGVARIAIHTPAVELPFAGHPTLGTAWLLWNLGEDVSVIRCVAGDVPAWQEGELAWIRARPGWVRGIPEPDRLATAAAVDSIVPPAMGEPGHYVWAWEDQSEGRIRARFFPTDLGIAEDEATGAAAVLLGAALGRDLTIRQGVGSEIHVRPRGDGSVDVGGRVELTEHRAHGG